MDTGLRDSVILVTGASGGIGIAITRALAEEGARVAIQYRTNERIATQLRDALEPDAIALPADLRDEASVDALFQEVLRQFGRLDGIVVNAGTWVEHDVPVCEMSLAQWNETLDSDLTTAFLTCRAFLRHVADEPRDHASIVLIGSTAALFGEAGHADYAAAKAGMVFGLMRSLKNEIVKVAPMGRVNAVCPGWIVTPMTEALLEDHALVERVMSTMALKKIGQPDDVANAVVFLSSDTLAGHVSGAVIPVAGGMEGRLLDSPKS